jgi:DNA-binding NtrC family response regulator
MQTKLLRVVQEQKIMHVGGHSYIDIDVRFVVATNRNLAAMVEAGEFRHDLYHRLNVVNIHMPALRERREDIAPLIEHFVQHFAAQFHRDVQGFDHDSMQRLCAYHWPGNVRELRNLVERHVALADAPHMHVESLPGPRRGKEIDADLPSLAELEKRYILKVLDRHDGNREQTAGVLGINKSTLWRKLQAYTRDD